jgi:TRAP-type C4-dicarboxylate transport system permease small subunit
VQTKSSDASGRGPERDQGVDEGSWFTRAVNALSNVCGFLSGLAVVAILVLISCEIVLRQFRSSLLVTDEFGGYLNAAVVFLGLAYTLRHGGFIRVEILYDNLGPRMKSLATWVLLTVSTVFIGVLFYVAIKHITYSYTQDTRAVSVLETPEWIPQLTMVLGLAVLLLQLIALVIARARNVP